MITRRNFATNPSGETASGFSNNNGAWTTITNDAVFKHSGAQSKKSAQTTPLTTNVIVSSYDVGGAAANNLVSPGKIYTASVYVAHNCISAPVTGFVQLQFLDASSTIIATVNGTAISIPGDQSWVRLFVTSLVSPPATNRCRVSVTLNKPSAPVTASEFGWMDDVLIEEGSSVGEYFDGATVSTDKTIRNTWIGTANASISQQELLPNVARRNLCPNPSFEVDFTNWVTLGAGVTLTKSSAVTAYSGTSELSVAYTNPVTGVQTTFNNLIIGRQYIVSTPIWNPVGNPSVGINIPTIGSSSRTNTNAQWQVLSLAFVATATSHTIQLNVNGTGGSNLFYVDGVMLEEGSALGSYFDGGTPWDTNKYSWYGTANNSVSLLEPLTVGFRRNYCPNPQPTTLTGWFGVTTSIVAAPWNALRSAFKSVANGAGTAFNFSAVAAANNLKTGDVVTVSGMIQVQAGKWYRVFVHELENNKYYNDALSTTYILSDGNSVRVSRTATLVDNGTNKHDVNMALVFYEDNIGTIVANGTVSHLGDVLIEKAGSASNYFDGSFGWDTNKYYWLGTANLSESFAEPITLVRRNSCLNPNLETNITWWGALSSVSAPTVSASGPYSGNNRGSAIGNNTGTSPRVYLFATYAGAKNGDTWTLQYKVKKIGTWPSGGSHYPAIRYQIVGGGEQVLINNVVTTGPDANGWFTVSSTATCTVNCDGRIQINVGFLTLSANLDVTGELAWDEVCLEKTNSALPYFDGNTLSDAATDYEWQNIVNGSESYGIARSNAQLIGRQSDIFKQLVASGYGPGSLADMEYKRLISKTGVTPPVKLSIADLYALAGEKNRIPAFRR